MSNKCPKCDAEYNGCTIYTDASRITYWKCGSYNDHQSQPCRIRELEQQVAELTESVQHWKIKAECYGNIVHGCSPVLASAGHPVDKTQKDGAIGGIRRAVEALTAERDGCGRNCRKRHTRCV